MMLHNYIISQLHYKPANEKKKIKRDKFLPEEDRLIIILYTSYGPNWDRISLEFGETRSKRQLRERWQNYLNPLTTPFYTPEDDRKLLSLFSQLGSQWATIAKIMGGKSAVSVRNRHRILLKKLRIEADFCLLNCLDGNKRN